MATLAPTPRLLGREGELQALGDAFDRVASGHLTAVIVEGEAGIGKTRLLAEVAGAGGNALFVTELVGALLEEGAIQVADGRAEATETGLPPTLRLTILRRLGFLVLLTTLVAGLLAWAAPSLLARSPRTARWWPFIGSTAIAVSLTGPNYLADGAAAVVLITMHVAVGFILIWGFARFGRPPSWTSQWGSGTTSAR